MADETIVTDDILSLETMLVRPKIKIDGAEYELTAPGELSIEQNYRLADLGRKLANLRGTAGLAPAQQKQLTASLTAICDIILVHVPQEVRAQLRDSHKISVTEVFTMLLQAEKVALAGGTISKMLTKLIGEKSFPGSSASTAEAPKAG